MRGVGLRFIDESANDLDIQTLSILEDYLDARAQRYPDKYTEDGGWKQAVLFGKTKPGSRIAEKNESSKDLAGKAMGMEGLAENGLAVSGNKKKPDFMPQKLKFSYKEQREYETIDDDIARLEEKLGCLEKQIAANATNSVKLRELMAEQEEMQQQLDEKMDRWVYLNDLAEQIEAQKE